MLFLHTAYATQLNAQVIIGIEGKQVVHQHSPARSERQSDVPLMLLLILLGTKGYGKRRRGWTTNGEATDHPAGIQVAFH